ncbi:acyltransferase [Pseudoxanthomonas sp. 10H]|uniref:acyltransferase n=1 Tax=Pseudoxanthomonas sp. 10H TaxID=3242729 RepID=UPI003558EC22
MSAASQVPAPALAEWRDGAGNRVLAPAGLATLTTVFEGRDCSLEIDPRARLGAVTVEFRGSNAHCRIGPGGPAGSFAALIRLGQDCRVEVGAGVTTTARAFLAASEGTRLLLGEDCMLASDIQLRTDDAHPIFDVHTGQRINPAQDVVIGAHVWLAYGVRCLGGARIGDGSVIGMGSLVNGPVPNNCIAVGTPARVVRRDVAWERPHLSMDPPAYKPDAGSVVRSRYWQATCD